MELGPGGLCRSGCRLRRQVAGRSRGRGTGRCTTPGYLRQRHSSPSLFQATMTCGSPFKSEIQRLSLGWLSRQLSQRTGRACEEVGSSSIPSSSPCSPSSCAARRADGGTALQRKPSNGGSPLKAAVWVELDAAPVLGVEDVGGAEGDAGPARVRLPPLRLRRRLLCQQPPLLLPGLLQRDPLYRPPLPLGSLANSSEGEDGLSQ